MSCIKVSIEQARDRRIFFLKPINTKIEPGHEFVFMWHSDIGFKDHPAAKLPLTEPGKYRCTYISEQSEGELTLKFTGPYVAVPNEYSQKTDTEMHEHTFYPYYISDICTPLVWIRVVNETSIPRTLVMDTACLIIQLIR